MVGLWCCGRSAGHGGTGSSGVRSREHTGLFAASLREGSSWEASGTAGQGRGRGEAAEWRPEAPGPQGKVHAPGGGW